MPRQAVDAPDANLPFTADAYLSALQAHQQRHPNPEWLSTHAKALAGCANELIASSQARSVPGAPDSPNADAKEAARRALTAASALAQTLGQCEDAARLANSVEAMQGNVGTRPATSVPTIWERLGISADQGNLTVRRAWPSDWNWWALLNLPHSAEQDNDEISLLWDGETLHSTRPVTFDGPLAIQSQVRAFGSDEHSFDLRFRLGSELFLPTFK